MLLLIQIRSLQHGQVLRNHHRIRPDLLLLLPPHDPLHRRHQLLIHRQAQQLVIQFPALGEIVFPPAITRPHNRPPDAAPVALVQLLLADPALLFTRRALHGPLLMRDCLQRGQDFVLGGTEGVDEDVSVGRFGGFVEDGGGGEAGGCQEGEVGGGGAGIGYSGGFGLEVEA